MSGAGFPARPIASAVNPSTRNSNSSAIAAASRISPHPRLDETTAVRTPFARRCRTTASVPSYRSTPSVASIS